MKRREDDEGVSERELEEIVEDLEEDEEVLEDED
jgi:hypothetical protein